VITIVSESRALAKSRDGGGSSRLPSVNSSSTRRLAPPS